MGFVSLKTKTALWAALLTLLSTGLLGGYLVWSSYQGLRTEVQQSQLALARTLAWEVDDGLSTALQAIALFAKDTRTQTMTGPDLVREMTLITSTTEFVDALLWFNKNGYLRVHSISNIPSRDFPPAPFIRGILGKVGKRQGPVQVDVYTAPSGDLEIGISAPVFTAGRLGGVLVGVMNLPNHVVGNMATARIGRSGYAYLVDPYGAAILRPDRAKGPLDLSSNPAVKAFQASGEGWIQFRGPEGEETTAAFASTKTSGWGVIVVEPASECYEPATRMLWETTLFVLFAMAVSVLLSIVLAGKFVDPILSLSKEVEGFRTWETFPGPKGIRAVADEVGILQQALFRMMGTIQVQNQEKEKAHQRALRAERRAAEAERLATVGQWSAGLAHEMNNPLTIILGASQVALKEKERGKVHWLQEIHREAERCRRLVVDLLEIAKPLKVFRKSCDLAALVKETWARIPASRGVYALECRPGRFPARVDPGRFGQVFLNLFRNAQDAMPKGGVVRVVMDRRPGRVRIQVTDQGVGVTRRDRPKLFRPFFTTKPLGTGLGLAMCQAILRAHQGKIRMEPNHPQGIRVVLEWPEPEGKGEES